jgi:cobalt-zinc-cadmium efflux system membrane fusion protein
VQGQYSGAGTPIELFTVGALDEVWGFADVFEMDLPRVQVGARVSVRVIAYPGKIYEGTVDWIAGALDPATRTARVRCTIKNPGRELKPEMYATMGIAVQRSRALAVPREAVLRLGDQTVVFVQTGRSENGLVKFERVPVDVDDTVSGNMLPVRHGLAAGQVVVTHGGILLSGMI